MACRVVKRAFPCPGTGCERVIVVPAGECEAICHCGQAITLTKGENMSKSVLDGMPVTESGLPPAGNKAFPQQTPILGIVGHCPACGSPIFGPSIVSLNDKPEIKFSCQCREVKSLADTMRTT